MLTKTQVFWDVTLCGQRYQRFGRQ